MIPEPKWIIDMETLDEYARECGGKCYVAKVELSVEIAGEREYILNVPKEYRDDGPHTVAFPLGMVSCLEFCDTYNKFTPGNRRKYFMEKYFQSKT